MTSKATTIGELLEEEIRKENLENKNNAESETSKSRIDFTFWENGEGSLSTNKTLQEDLDENYGADPPPVRHITIEARPLTYDEEALKAMVGMAWIEIAANGSMGEGSHPDCLLEKIVTEVFQAGMEYAKEIYRKE